MKKKKTFEKLLKERLERITKAIELKEPDRVPLFDPGGHLIAKYSGITSYEFYFNYDKARSAIVKWLKDFPFDSSFSSVIGAEGFVFSVAFSNYPDIAPAIRFLTGPMHDVLGDKYTRWPGRELSEDIGSLQFIGGEYMKPEEYKYLIENPIDFINEKILPRACLNLEKPGSQKTNATLLRLGIEAIKFLGFLQSIAMDLSNIGIPSLNVTFAYAPLDFIGDFLRHPTGAMLDLRRHPDDVKAVTEALVEPIIKVALALKPAGANIAFIPLHLNEMLSPKMHDEFYWPTLKKVIVELYNQGIKSLVFFEGDYTPFINTIKELPKGWGIAWFEKTDIRKAKEILGGHTCILGGIPISLLISGTPNKIKDYVKKLLEDIKPGGGVILSSNIALGLTKEVPLENIKTLINTVKRYGKY